MKTKLRQKGDTKHISVKVHRADYWRIKTISEAEGYNSLSDFVREAIAEKIEKSRGGGE